MSTRNHDIFRLRGCTNLFKNLPTDVAKHLGDNAVYSLADLILKLEKTLDIVNQKQFICSACANQQLRPLSKPTKNKRAYKCDYCNQWADNLYLIKPIQKG